jgi:hypothetical protein
MYRGVDSANLYYDETVPVLGNVTAEVAGRLELLRCQKLVCSEW